MGIAVSKSTTATVTFSTPQEIVISHLDDSIRIGDGTELVDVTAANALKTDSSHVTQPVSATALPLPTGAATAANQATIIGHVDGVESALSSILTELNQKTEPADTQKVDQNRPATAVVTQVPGSAVSVTLLASNVLRVQGSFYNDSNATLYLKFGATASTTSYTVRLARDAFYELQSPVYTGRIDGIWASATGNAYVTEVTP